MGRLAVLNGNSTDFNVFPHVPGKALARRDAIERILKRLQRENTSLRYQICLGDDDLSIMLKNHKEYDYVTYRKVSLKMIYPNNEVPEWDLTSNIHLKNDKPEENENGKRGAPESPEVRPAAKIQISDWQISEFIWAYLEGPQTTAQYNNLEWELEAEENEEAKEDSDEDEPENIQENDLNNE